jgi:hypothetical protein
LPAWGHIAITPSPPEAAGALRNRRPTTFRPQRLRTAESPRRLDPDVLKTARRAVQPAGPPPPALGCLRPASLALLSARGRGGPPERRLPPVPPSGILCAGPPSRLDPNPWSAHVAGRSLGSCPFPQPRARRTPGSAARPRQTTAILFGNRHLHSHMPARDSCNPMLCGHIIDHGSRAADEQAYHSCSARLAGDRQKCMKR